MEQESKPTTPELMERYLELVENDPKQAQAFVERHKGHQEFMSAMNFVHNTSRVFVDELPFVNQYLNDRADTVDPIARQSLDEIFPEELAERVLERSNTNQPDIVTFFKKCMTCLNNIRIEKLL